MKKLYVTVEYDLKNNGYLQCKRNDRDRNNSEKGR